MLCRHEENIVTTDYQKVTNTDAYLNWNSFAPHSWKRGTLKTLTQRAYMICSTTELLDTELKNLEVFLEKNNFRNGQLGKFSHKLSLLMAVIRHHLLSKQ